MIKLLSLIQHRNEIIRLWQDSFGDSEEYITFFLDNCRDCDALGYFIDNRLVSMFFLLNGKICNKRCKYLYAACTAKNYRRQGIMGKLINYAADYCKCNGYEGIFLVPANDKLYSYYSKFGFISSFSKLKFTLKTQKSVNFLSEDEIDITDVVNKKKSLLSNVSGFLFDDNEILYTVKEHLFNGGNIVYNSSSLAFYYKDEAGELTVEELLTDSENIIEAAEKLFLNYPVENIYISTPIVYNSTDIVGEYTKCGMCLPLNKDLSDYLNENKTLYAGMYLE